MIDRFIEPGRLPTAEQTLMLHAALLPGDAGKNAARTWLASADIQRLGKASRGILPILYERIRKDGFITPLMPTLKGVKRHTWFNNRRLFHYGGDAVRLLKEAGVEVMIIKGAAMVIAYYHDESKRPMEDLDILVRYHDARNAVRVLREHGWRMQHTNSVSEQYLQEGLYEFGRATHFIHAAGVHLDLHWNLTDYSLGKDADDDFWAAADECKFEGHQVRVLHPADQLLHILVHGTPWSTISPIRWIPDTIAVLESCPELDWDRLIGQANQRSVSLMVSNALQHLEGHFPGLVPLHVFSSLNSRAYAGFESLEYWSITRSFSPGLRSIMLFHICRYLRHSKDHSFIDKILLLPAYLRLRWGVKNLSQLLIIITVKVSKYLSKGAL